MGRPKLSEKVTKYTATLSQRDIELAKELGGSAWLRMGIGAERFGGYGLAKGQYYLLTHKHANFSKQDRLLIKQLAYLGN